MKETDAKGGAREMKAANRRRLYEKLPEEESSVAEEQQHPAVTAKCAAPDRRTSLARQVVGNFTMLSAGTAFIPVPYVDMAANSTAQMLMLKKLCDIYGLEFSNQMAKAGIASFLGGVHIGMVSGALLKIVPLIGLAGSVATSAVYSGAFTFAIGMVFIRHFESGGTFLDFDPEKVRDYFARQFEAGKTIISKQKLE